PAYASPTSMSHTSSIPTHSPTLSLHDALPIWPPQTQIQVDDQVRSGALRTARVLPTRTAAPDELDRPRRSRASAWRARGRCARSDRKSTRLNSSHEWISYAVFCLKKKKSTT